MSTPCPDCGAPLTAPDRCEACGLSLTGPAAARLWWVDQQLASLGAERITLLAQLRGTQLQPALAATVVPQPAWTPPPAREATPHSAQNTLLGLGALLLAAAVLVFAAVTYNHLGAGGRAAVLILLTALAGAAAQTLSRRRLPDSAEAVGAVALVLAVADAWAVRRAGLGQSMPADSYAAAASAVLAVVSGLWATVTPLRITQGATAAFANGAVLLELSAHHGDPARTGLVLSLLAAADAAAALVVPWVVTRFTAAGFGAVSAVAVLGTAAASFHDQDPAGAAGLAVLALVAAGLAASKVPAAAAGVPVLAAAAGWVASRPELTDAQRPLVLAAVALLSLQGAALLKDRTEPVLGALAVAVAALLSESLGIVETLGGPFTWASDAWSFTGSRARDAVGPELVHWDGTVVTVIVLAAAAAAAWVGGLLTDRDTKVPAALLLGLAGVALPLGLATDFRTAIVIQLALATALCVAGFRVPALAVAGLSLAAIATAWSLAQQDTTLAAVPVAAVLTAALAVRWGWLTGPALLLAAGELAAVGAAQDLHTDQVGALLLAAVGAAVAASHLLTGERRLSAETSAVALGTVSVVLTAGDPGWWSWAFAVNGLLALVVAVRADRRAVGYAGALLLSASSWVRLADAHVHAPEPYVLPLAVMTLAIGHLRRRQHPAMGSFEAYAAGLTLALAPSLLKSLDDVDPYRALVVLVAGAAVVLVGAQQRLRAPLVIGGSAAAVEAVHLLAPYAAALPRWVVLASAGALLLGVGATYEQRLRDVNRIRERFDSFG